MRKLFLISAILTFAVPPSASASDVKHRSSATAPSTEALANNIRKLAIAGVHWGQREENAIQALRANGFEVAAPDKSTTKTFDKQVEAYLEYPQRSDHTYDVEARKANETVGVRFISFPDGWRVHIVRYDYLGGQTPDELRKAAETKYTGQGLKAFSDGWSYICTTDWNQCFDFPHIIIRDTGEFSMELVGGEKGDRSENKPFEEAVSERKGRTAPTF